MKRNRVASVCCLLVFCLGVTPAWSQVVTTAGEEASHLVEQLELLNRSLARLVELQERLLGNQRVDLLLKRIALEERRLAPLEKELLDARREFQELESRLEMIRGELDLQEENLREALMNGADAQKEQFRTAVDEMRRFLDIAEKRRDDMSARIRLLEDDLAEGREEIATLDAMLRELVD